jgi:hypothetical protein
VKNFIWNKKPLVEGDVDFIYDKDDLITLRPGRESAWLDAVIERILKAFPREWVQYVFCSKVGCKENPVLFSLIKTCKQSTRARVSGLAHKLLSLLLGANFIQHANASDTGIDNLVPITLTSTSPEGWPFPLAAFGIIGAIRVTVWYVATPATRAKELLLFDGIGMGLTGLLHLMIINDKPRIPVVYWT